MNLNKIENKKILLIVPHQDDEINIAGGVLYTFSKNNSIKVVYVTNGDYIYESKIRYKEAISALKKLNINKKDIIFLGYCDQPYDSETHMYNSSADWVSLHKVTSGIKKIKEWSYGTYNIHQELNKDNLIKDIRDIIVRYCPDMIFSVDLDFHPDHIMTSLCFEKAMGQVLNECQGKYQPIVLKTFAYENSYLGEKDFCNINDYPMKFDFKNNLVKNNPYYLRNEKINLCIDKKCYSKNLLINPVWKAIKCHKSQILVSHAEQIINSNYSYWNRVTNNLIYNAKITVSSGNHQYLHDFLLCDTDNVLNGNEKEIVYNKAIWIPDNDDEQKEILIEFNNYVFIDFIKLYNGRINNNFIKKIAIYINNRYERTYELNEKNLIQKIYIQKRVKNIKIKILDKIIYNGFSEIELLSKEECFINNKVNIQNTWSDVFYTVSKEKTEYQVSNIEDKIEVDIDNLKRGKFKNGKIILSNKSSGYINFKIKDGKDTIFINKSRIFRVISTILNKNIIKICIICNKIYRKFIIDIKYKKSNKIFEGKINNKLNNISNVR